MPSGAGVQSDTEVPDAAHKVLPSRLQWAGTTPTHASEVQGLQEQGLLQQGLLQASSHQEAGEAGPDSSLFGGLIFSVYTCFSAQQMQRSASRKALQASIHRKAGEA